MLDLACALGISDCVASSRLSTRLSRDLNSSSYSELTEELSNPWLGERHPSSPHSPSLCFGRDAYCFWDRDGILSFSSLPLPCLRHQHGDDIRIASWCLGRYTQFRDLVPNISGYVEEITFVPLFNAGLALTEWSKETVLRDGPVWRVVSKLKHQKAA